MVQGWLVGSPLASDVSVGWWEGVGRDGDGGTVVLRKPENRTSSSFFFLSLTFLNIQSVEYFGKGKTQPSTGCQLVLVSYIFFRTFFSN
jgi:hypothetical protein